MDTTIIENMDQETRNNFEKDYSIAETKDYKKIFIGVGTSILIGCLASKFAPEYISWLESTEPLIIGLGSGSATEFANLLATGSNNNRKTVIEKYNISREEAHQYFHPMPYEEDVEKEEQSIKQSDANLNINKNLAFEK
ncbi:MAG: hypothetical protein N4A47_00525 [Clostridia bacterium]|jgi:hypothetical protein|nr:hypothetical protein [Clostridia bacterium]